MTRTWSGGSRYGGVRVAISLGVGPNTCTYDDFQFRAEDRRRPVAPPGDRSVDGMELVS